MKRYGSPDAIITYWLRSYRAPASAQPRILPYTPVALRSGPAGHWPDPDLDGEAGGLERERTREIALGQSPESSEPHRPGDKPTTETGQITCYKNRTF